MEDKLRNKQSDTQINAEKQVNRLNGNTKTQTKRHTGSQSSNVRNNCIRRKDDVQGQKMSLNEL